MLRKRFLFVTFMFLLALLLPAGWIAALPAFAHPSAPLSESNTSHMLNIPFLGPWCVDPVRANVAQINDSTSSLPSKTNVDTTSLVGTATVGGFVWYDINGNGIQDNGEPGVDEVRCILCRFGDNVPVAVSSTDTIGNYSFTITDTSQITPSDLYYIVFQQPNGFTFSVGDVNGDDHNNVDSDVIISDVPNTGRTDYFGLTTSRVNSSGHTASTNVDLDVGITLIEGNEGLLTPVPTPSVTPTTRVIPSLTPTTRVIPSITPTNTIIPSTTPTFYVLPPVTSTPTASATSIASPTQPTRATPIASATPTATVIPTGSPTPTATVTKIGSGPASSDIPSKKLALSNRQTSNNAMCGPMDVVFVLDETGSMREPLSGAILDSSVINQINSMSAGDYQLGLVTFKDDVQVDVDLGANTDAAVLARVGGFTPFQGLGEPEPSAEALNTVINGLDAGSTRPRQIGDFNGLWRSEAKKIIILATDAPPGGFDDSYQVGTDDINARLRALEAAADGIAISAIELDVDTTTQPIMSQYANETRGCYIQANDSQQVIQGMHTIINNCGCSISNIYLPFTSR